MELHKGQRGPKKGTRHTKHKYLYIDEKGKPVYQWMIDRRKRKRGRPSKESIRKKKEHAEEIKQASKQEGVKQKPKKTKFIASNELIKEVTDKSAETWIKDNAGIALRLASDYAERYNVLKQLDHNMLMSVESPSGKKISSIVPLGSFGELVQEAMIGMWTGLKLYAERAKQAEQQIKPTTAMYKGAQDRLDKVIFKIISKPKVEVPLPILRKMNTLARYEMDLAMENGRLPTISELSEKTGYTSDSIKEMRRYRQVIFAHSTEEQMETGGKPVTLLETIKDPQNIEENYIDSVLKREKDKAIVKALNNLEPFEKEIMVRRFGLGAEELIVPPRIEEFTQKFEVQITGTVKKKRAKSEYEKQMERVAGKKEAKSMTHYKVKSLSSGKSWVVDPSELKDVRKEGDKTLGVVTRRIIKQVGEEKKTLMPKQSETYEELSEHVKVPTRTIGKKNKVTEKFDYVSPQRIKLHFFPIIMKKLRQDPELKRVWEEQESDILKSFTAELLKVRYKLA